MPKPSRRRKQELGRAAPAAGPTAGPGLGGMPRRDMGLGTIPADDLAVLLKMVEAAFQDTPRARELVRLLVKAREVLDAEGARASPSPSPGQAHGVETIPEEWLTPMERTLTTAVLPACNESLRDGDFTLGSLRLVRCAFHEAGSHVALVPAGILPKLRAALAERDEAREALASRRSACHGCLRVGRWKRCGRCSRARFCSQECLKTHWPAHKEACRAVTVGSPTTPPPLLDPPTTV